MTIPDQESIALIMRYTPHDKHDFYRHIKSLKVLYGQQPNSPDSKEIKAIKSIVMEHFDAVKGHYSLHSVSVSTEHEAEAVAHILLLMVASAAQHQNITAEVAAETSKQIISKIRIIKKTLEENWRKQLRNHKPGQSLNRYRQKRMTFSLFEEHS